MSDKLVIYHAGCLDGFTAAWVAVRTLESMGQSCDILDATYGDLTPLPEMYRGKSVYIVDFSYPGPDMEVMWKYADRLRVLDHHASAEENCKDLSFCTFDQERSGAGMVLDHWANEAPPAIGSGGMDLIDFVEDYDLWKWEFKETLLVHFYLPTIEQTLSNWDQLAEDMANDYTRVWRSGQSILSYTNKLIGEIAGLARKGRLPVWGGYKQDVLMVNCPPQLTSMVGDWLLDLYHQEPMVAMWYQDGKGTYQFSLRSRSAEECRVDQVAGYYSGGGHHCAAGFRSGEL